MGFLCVCICTLRAVICIPSGSALGNIYNSTQGTNAIHTTRAHKNGRGEEERVTLIGACGAGRIFERY